MSAQKRHPTSVVGALLGFIGMSAIAGLLVAAVVTPAIAVTGKVTDKGAAVFNGLPTYLKGADKMAQRTVLTALDDDGKEVTIANFFMQNRVPVKWDDIAQSAKDSVIAGEDIRFYEHGGVDVQGTIRALVSNLRGNDIQGASSITQQLVKNMRLQKCEMNPVPPAPDPADKPSKENAPDEDEFDDPEEYEDAVESYKEFAANYEKMVANHDKGEKRYEKCISDASSLTIERKLTEMKYAIGLEKEMTKNEILHKYLNIAYFGGNVYGIQAAAQHYFSVDAKDLTLAQSASLVAITNNPYYFKLDDPDSESNGEDNGYALNKKRRDYILDELYEHDMISKKDYDEALKTKIEPKIKYLKRGCETAGINGFFCDYVKNVVKDDPTFGDTSDERWAKFQTGGYHIQTTLDLDLQKTAHTSVTDRVPPQVDGVDLGAASVSVEPGTGRILTMTQSRAFSNDSDNPDTTAVNWSTDHEYGGSNGFQPGSTYKIFTLAEWLRTGHSLNAGFNASKHDYSQSEFTNSCGGTGVPHWTVDNDDNEGGYYSVTRGTARSVNTVFMQMAAKLDLCNIGKMAKAFDVHTADGSELDTYPSSVIGAASTVSPLTMATAIAGFANKGEVCTPIAIDKITGVDGEEVEPPKSDCTQAVSPKVAAAADAALQEVTDWGGTAGSSNPHDGTAFIGKTGTTDHNKQTWAILSSTNYAIATWVGQPNSEKTDLRTIWLDDGQAAQLRHPITHDILVAADAKYGGDAFPDAEGKYFERITAKVPEVRGLKPDEAEGLLASAGFYLGDTKDTDGSQPKGTVEKTDPSVGSEVSKGETVSLYLSRGNMDELPNVVGQDKDSAKSALSQAGFTKVSTHTQKTSDSSQDGRVIDMSPSPGSSTKTSTKITLTIGELEEQKKEDDDHDDGHDSHGDHGDDDAAGLLPGGDG